MSGRTRGRPVLGAITGLFFGLFLGFDLLLLGKVPLESPALVVLPIAFLVIGFLLGMLAPLRMLRR